MDNLQYFYKDAFAVIGKAGRGPAADPHLWIMPLWDEANARYAEIAPLVKKNRDGAPIIWGAMNDITESNKRWDDKSGKYMTGCEAEPHAAAPEGWAKWIIPAQTYLVAGCRMDGSYGKAFNRVTSDPNICVVGAIHELYPNLGDAGAVELWFPIAGGMMFCHSCAMPMTKTEDFGGGVYCRHCYADGAPRCGVTMDELIADIRALMGVEAAHPNLISTPLLKYLKAWLPLDAAARTAALPTLLSALTDGQDCDFTGTRWEAEWLADGRVCHCVACVAARKCISDIKLMEGGGK